MIPREWLLAIWVIASSIWVSAAIYNFVAVSVDLYYALIDHPTDDEKTIAWQRWRDTSFLVFLALLFTTVALLQRQANINEDNEPERPYDFVRATLTYAVVLAPIIGAIFEGWRIVDRTRMKDAYQRLYQRSKTNE